MKVRTQLDADRFRLENEETAYRMPCNSPSERTHVDKEAREAAEKPAKNLTPRSFPSANPLPYASLSKLHSSSTKSLILLFIGLPSIQIIKTVER